MAINRCLHGIDIGERHIPSAKLISAVLLTKQLETTGITQ